ncbi:hypothetical protein C8Q80DRAFT_560561 [Daedaleopsis nitida]|nr:hypothetical protein C8Q80DRAFT_560561 [Daedaleopsis nitida]
MMSYPPFLTLAMVAVVVLQLPTHGKAQYSTVTCEPEYIWMNNSEDQDPCLVISYLAVPCDGTDFVVTPLEDDLEVYVGPTEQDDCQCNTVFYSMVEACQVCQGSPIRPVVTWEIWTYSCSTTYTTYPTSLSPETAVPQWALANVQGSGTFNATAAQVIAAQGFPDSTAIPVPSLTSTSTTTTESTSETLVTFVPTTSSSSTSSTESTSATTTTAVTPTSAADVTSKRSTSNVAAIVGGVVGGVLGLLLIGTMIFFMLLRQRRLDRAAPAIDATSTTERPVSTLDGGDTAKSPRMVSAPPSILYNPEDPRTYPSADPTAFMSRATSPTPSMAMSGYRHPLVGSGSGDYPQFGYSGIGSGYAGSTYKGTPEL